MSLSITALEKSVRAFAKTLEKQGFTINDIDVFKDGTKGGSYGGSYVELNISHNDFWETYKFKPKYGFSSGTEFNDSKWSDMKAKCLESINKEVNLIN